MSDLENDNLNESNENVNENNDGTNGPDDLEGNVSENESVEENKHDNEQNETIDDTDTAEEKSDDNNLDENKNVEEGNIDDENPPIDEDEGEEENTENKGDESMVSPNKAEESLEDSDVGYNDNLIGDIINEHNDKLEESGFESSFGESTTHIKSPVNKNPELETVNEDDNNEEENNGEDESKTERVEESVEATKTEPVEESKEEESKEEEKENEENEIDENDENEGEKEEEKEENNGEDENEDNEETKEETKEEETEEEGGNNEENEEDNDEDDENEKEDNEESVETTKTEPIEESKEEEEEEKENDKEENNGEDESKTERVEESVETTKTEPIEESKEEENENEENDESEMRKKEEESAIKIESLFRAKKAREDVERLKRERAEEELRKIEEEAAARQKKWEEEEREKAEELERKQREEESAIKIESLFRAKKAREDVERLRREKEEEEREKQMEIERKEKEKEEKEKKRFEELEAKLKKIEDENNEVINENRKSKKPISPITTIETHIIQEKQPIERNEFEDNEFVNNDNDADDEEDEEKKVREKVEEMIVPKSNRKSSKVVPIPSDDIQPIKNHRRKQQQPQQSTVENCNENESMERVPKAKRYYTKDSRIPPKKTVRPENRRIEKYADNDEDDMSYNKKNDISNTKKRYNNRNEDKLPSITQKSNVSVVDAQKLLEIKAMDRKMTDKIIAKYETKISQLYSRIKTLEDENTKLNKDSEDYVRKCKEVSLHQSKQLRLEQEVNRQQKTIDDYANRLESTLQDNKLLADKYMVVMEENKTLKQKLQKLKTRLDGSGLSGNAVPSDPSNNEQNLQLEVVELKRKLQDAKKKIRSLKEINENQLSYNADSKLGGGVDKSVEDELKHLQYENEQLRRIVEEDQKAMKSFLKRSELNEGYGDVDKSPIMRSRSNKKSGKILPESYVEKSNKNSSVYGYPKKNKTKRGIQPRQEPNQCYFPALNKQTPHYVTGSKSSSYLIQPKARDDTVDFDYDDYPLY